MVAASYRDIVLEDITAKDFHKSLRRAMLDDFVTYARPTQFGGVPGRGTDLCQHVGQAAREATAAANKCGWQLY
eukprot:3794285-Lingulodinium_polyedra.AAC.1